MDCKKIMRGLLGVTGGCNVILRLWQEGNRA